MPPNSNTLPIICDILIWYAPISHIFPVLNRSAHVLIPAFINYGALSAGILICHGGEVNILDSVSELSPSVRQLFSLATATIHLMCLGALKYSSTPHDVVEINRKSKIGVSITAELSCSM